VLAEAASIRRLHDRGAEIPKLAAMASHGSS
jgi:hypothetical protein